MGAQLASPAKIVVVDLDGTLLNSKLELSAANIAAVRRAAHAGATIVLASGRLPASVLLHAESLACCSYTICCNGAACIRLDTKAVVLDTPLPIGTVRAVTDFCSKRGLDLIGYTTSGAFATRETAAVKLETLRSDVRPEIVGSLLAIQDTIKFLVIGDSLHMRQVAAEIIDLGGLAASISYPEYVDVVAAGVTKASALSILLDELGATWNDVIAIGDGLNDVPLLARAGTGVAMANGTVEAHTAAHFIAPAHDENGAALALAAILFDDREARPALSSGGRA